MLTLRPEGITLDEENREFLIEAENPQARVNGPGFHMSAEVFGQLYEQNVGPIPSGGLTRLRDCAFQSWPLMEPALRREIERKQRSN